MRLAGIGYHELTPLDVPQSLEQEDLGSTRGSQVSYQWSQNLREWWVNEEAGLEQWFALQEAPAGRIPDAPLHLRMTLETDMQVAQQSNRLTLTKGKTTLHYDKLKVWDATGKELEATMHYAAGNLDFYITDANATYPLLIDPTWTQEAYLKASNTGEGHNFGRSVAISGERILIGAINEGSNATGIDGDQANNSAINAGAAYVFALPAPPPSISVAVAPATTAEDDAAELVFTFTASAAPSSDIIVNFSVSGTATFNDDYLYLRGAETFNGSAGTVKIPAGQTSASVVLQVRADADVEPDETLTLTVENP
ncbi:MAG: FG-GAP repeat protein [Bernardetiaceae bacterium]